MHNVPDQSESTLSLEVEWAPAYELLISLGAFVFFSKHALLELGQPWVAQVRAALPGEFVAGLTRKSVVTALKQHGDLLYVLIRACPRGRDVRGFLEWLSDLTPGAAYEAVVHRLEESAPGLPREFAPWRDRMVELLDGWDSAYFRHVDPAILSALEQEAARLGGLAGTAPVLDLVETVTNGIRVEPSPRLRSVVLIPQYHQRPYNTDAAEQHALILLYPADVIAASGEAPPLGLLRLTHALSDDSRLRILRFLADGPNTLTEVARFAGLSQPTVHHHLVHLRAAGLVRVHFASGSASRYSLRPHALEQLSQQLGAYLTPASRKESPR
jgi:DNA-binding transcriptional ArsR family regulator